MKNKFFKQNWNVNPDPEHFYGVLPYYSKNSCNLFTFFYFINKLNSLHKLDKDGADPFSINFLCDEILLLNPTVILHRG